MGVLGSGEEVSLGQEDRQKPIQKRKQHKASKTFHRSSGFRFRQQRQLRFITVPAQRQVLCCRPVIAWSLRGRPVRGLVLSADAPSMVYSPSLRSHWRKRAILLHCLRHRLNVNVGNALCCILEAGQHENRVTSTQEQGVCVCGGMMGEGIVGLLLFFFAYFPVLLCVCFSLYFV